MSDFRPCSPELERYAACVDGHSGTWLVDCDPLKSQLNACASSYSGLVEAIKSRCKPQIDQYERCLKANPARPETCTGKLEALGDCTEGREAQRLVAQQQQQPNR
ncbi:hypothetical protein EMIHUDRAFT_215476 [Emiliania huxleyi CCMP1516]|uniref:IMS import disulfide relay-system CHCH-CHCH-like Cx9C domain-containing protein n=2 Tax=Emiliania huxleyi TaxID=2903 RepID=A0A0D3IHF2_EMIH1|nr:hypothetical protein EMIHUDRAFT_215476 [Emiliania huxleyi CCMP1516]EOD10687.1 hypothetical protein EMIHUDRAFT_215476 [Emiliania huxleyi CCMP1516]|eukprot:XP_005763116.1 hypothetical protein EMIHUDRAFT_215476 [Emiliania huxleyi CCMP1516]